MSNLWQVNLCNALEDEVIKNRLDKLTVGRMIVLPNPYSNMKQPFISLRHYTTYKII